ncbi:MAG: transketolase C-terminal domain-containing protein [Chloroherpetonaceae bacterium]|nr:transketolase [Chloroherpetonaceae bacterium]MDW8019461.1 transketolase C-terminal domain-containing protein [Chloroherpetonaceae bacterium]MDW8464695.1 transketolase C-terminal domain-containing protein [Chloroherpetonaceae bacterium]
MTYEDVLKEIAQKSDKLIVMTAENRAAIRNLPPQLGKRFIDVGIAEQTMIGMAAGLALRGRYPIVHALATFLVFRAYEFIRDDVAIPNLPVKMVGGVPGFLSDANGPTHQAIEDVALMRGLPNVMVFCPSDAEELAEGIKVLAEYPAPCYIRHNPHPAPVRHIAPFEIGKAETLSNGNDIAILVYGFLLREAVKAKDILEAQGKSVRLINIRMPKPIDAETVLRAARECKLVVTLEDHFLTGGLYSIVAELLLKHQLMANVLPIALEHRWFKPALLDRVLEYEGFTGRQIAERILSALA